MFGLNQKKDSYNKNLNTVLTHARQAVWIIRNNTVYDKMITAVKLFTHSFKAHVRLLRVVKKEKKKKKKVWDKSAPSQRHLLVQDHEEGENRSLDFASRKTGEKNKKQTWHHKQMEM